MPDTDENRWPKMEPVRTAAHVEIPLPALQFRIFRIATAKLGYPSDLDPKPRIVRLPRIR